MSGLSRILGAFLTAAIALPVFAQSVGLEQGSPLRFTMQPSTFANAIHVDVPQGAREMRLSLTVLNGNHDLDLLLRQGSAFPASAGGGMPLFPDWLIDHAQYRSISSTAEERIVVGESSAVPLAAGRWHLGVLSFANAAAEVELRVEFNSQPTVEFLNIDFNAPSASCDVAPWNSVTPRDPVVGNAGTTLGQQRRIALEEAIRALSEELKPMVGARIRACWRDLGSSDTGLTLAQAGPTGYWLNAPGDGYTGQFLPERQMLYSRAAAVKLAGTDYCRYAGGACSGQHDLTITFNTRVDDTDTLNGWGFSYGTLRQNLSQVDFVVVAMHEIAHGLGFIGLASRTHNPPSAYAGDRIFPWDDAFTRYARYTPTGGPSTGIPLFEVPREDRITAMTSGDKLRFAGPATSSSFDNNYSSLPAPDRYARMHAPSAIQSGSTLSHFSTLMGPNLLMLAQIPQVSDRRMDLAEPLLRDVGWERAARAPKTFPLPESVQYYDINRSGHGFDFQKVAGVDNFYFVTFYTFNSQGNPEWYVSVGPVIDGTFMPARTANGDSLQRFFYNPDGPPFQIADDSAGFDGQLRIDFVDAALAPICRDTREDLNLTLAVMTWTINGDNAEQWCVSRIVGDSGRAQVDFSSTWYAGPTDSGWGFSVQSFRAGSNDGLAFALYYADTEGNPQWAIAQSLNYDPAQSMPLRRLQGYCRTCPRPEGALPETVVGSVTLSLFEPGQGTDRVSFDIDLGNGQRFQRENVPIIPASTPRYRNAP